MHTQRNAAESVRRSPCPLERWLGDKSKCLPSKDAASAREIWGDTGGDVGRSSVSRPRQPLEGRERADERGGGGAEACREGGMAGGSCTLREGREGCQGEGEGGGKAGAETAWRQRGFPRQVQLRHLRRRQNGQVDGASNDSTAPPPTASAPAARTGRAPPPPAPRPPPPRTPKECAFNPLISDLACLIN